MSVPDPGVIIIWFVVFLLSLTVHECAHALVADRFGDATGRYLGRVTLNPLPHIDLFGTVIFPLLALTTGGWMFGWAKPVPFVPSNLRDRRMGEISIALAGPVSNFILAAIFILLYKLLFQGPLAGAGALGDLVLPIHMLVEIGIRMNIVLGVFNLIPVPPLDGHHVVRNLLPDSLAEMYMQIPSWIGFIILFLMVRAGITDFLMDPLFGLVNWFIE